MSYYLDPVESCEFVEPEEETHPGPPQEIWRASQEVGQRKWYSGESDLWTECSLIMELA